MYILGISAFYHDSAAALLCDGDLVAAAQEERFSRVKFDHRFPKLAVQFCLDEAGIRAEDVDYVAYYEKPLQKFERILLSHLTTFPRSWRVFREATIAWFGDKLWIANTLQEHLPVSRDRLMFVEHHLSHAASAMFCSPFKDAAVMTVDGVGEWATTTTGHATGDWDDGSRNDITLTDEIRFPHSLGLLYSAFTAWLGFKVNSGEYKVMGMAPYGEPRYTDKVRKLLRVFDDGSFHLDMDYFSYHRSLDTTFSSKFVELFGEQREPEALFFTRNTGDDISGREEEAERNQYWADVAASIQRVTEETLLGIANHLHAKTGSDNLVMAGGVALNSVANGRIVRETPFKQVYIQPNAGDAGGALGAALYAWHVYLSKPRSFVMEHAYHGADVTDDDARAFLDGEGIAHESYADDERLAARIVDALVDGKVVGLCNGRFEWGPRALGARSILADPRHEDMKRIVNTKIKFREPFRPFAPVVPEEHASRYFDVDTADGQYPPRFMLMVTKSREEEAHNIPAVSHMGTARLQTIRREWNPLYSDIVTGFGEATGVPVLLNTSFNLRGEPVVASAADAYRTFISGDLDLLVVGRRVVSATGRTASPTVPPMGSQ